MSAIHEKKPIIDVRKLNKEFTVGKNQVHVLKDIDLEIYNGEFVILFGPSGCGKSTLLNTIIGLEEPTSGEVIVRGDNIYNLKEDSRAKFRRSKFGMVYQQPNWIKSLNVAENIAYPLMISGSKRGNAIKRANHVLDLFGLAEYSKYTPTELSGGQQQKTAMCRAFVTNPWILIADEPTGNLDSISSADVMNIFKFINEDSKRTILMVSHNLEYEKYATKIVYMRDGTIEKVVDKKKVIVSDDESHKDLLEMALEL